MKPATKLVRKLVRVEAKNFVSYRWALGANGASGATGYFISGRFCFGER